MNYWFGKTVQDISYNDDNLWKDIPAKRIELYQTSYLDIIKLLDGFSLHWENKLVIDRIVPGLIQESGFSEVEVRTTLSILPSLLKKESLEKRLKSEFIHPEVLDDFHKLPHSMARVKAVPMGMVLHVTAGNVFLSSIDSLIMGFLTKNISLLKVSSQNRVFPQFFAEQLKEFDKKNILADKFSILHWKGGDQKIESILKQRVNSIVAWGGEEMVESYRQSLPKNVKLLEFGPKISFQVITVDGLRNKNLSEVCKKIVDDITPWDQSACSSPQNLYLQNGIDSDQFIPALDLAFKDAGQRGEISDDESVELLKEKYRGFYSELMEDGKIIDSPDSHLIHLEQNKFLKPSPLHRSLIIKIFHDSKDLFTHIEPFSYYLQSCSYLFSESEKKEYLNVLSLSGIKRFAPLGTVTFGMDGAPHDGRFVLRELVQFIGDEFRSVDYGEKIESISSSTSLKKYFDENTHPPGYIFSSGGITGKPKFVHFSYEEFDYMTDMLAVNLTVQGVGRGMTVANLFVAGNLWSSFLAVEKALEKIGAIQLPIGGLCSTENIVLYLQKFRPDAIMGIPSLLVLNAEFCESKNISLTIPKVFYAGEALSELRRDYLKRVWKTEHFGSAGYASVDAGVIGYQCEKCGPGEHHIFSDLVEMKIIDEEAIITSVVRNTLPIQNYRTGDKVQWLENCSCGRKDKRFKLLGRTDNVIQIWSCRILVSDIEKALSELDKNILTYQIILKETREANVVREKLELHYEKHSTILEEEELLHTIYKYSRDLKDTISYDDFKKEVLIYPEMPGMIGRNGRTGKISLVLDQRR